MIEIIFKKIDGLQFEDKRVILMIAIASFCKKYPQQI